MHKSTNERWSFCFEQQLMNNSVNSNDNRTLMSSIFKGGRSNMTTGPYKISWPVSLRECKTCFQSGVCVFKMRIW